MHAPVRTRQSARKATLAAQAAAVVLIAGGGVLAAVGFPGLGLPEAPSAPAPGDTGTPGNDPTAGGPEDAYAAVVDPETVDMNLTLIANCPELPPEPTEQAGGDDPDPVEEPTEGIRFVGSIAVGGKAAAFLNIGGITKLLRPGGNAYEGVRLVSVKGDEIVVTIDDGPEQRIEKSIREGSAVSMVVGGAPKTTDTTAIADDGPASPARYTPDMSREERRAALLERTRSDRNRWERERGQDGGPPN